MKTNKYRNTYYKENVQLTTGEISLCVSCMSQQTHSFCLLSASQTQILNNIILQSQLTTTSGNVLVNFCGKLLK